MSGPTVIISQSLGTVIPSSQPGELQYSHEIIPSQPQAPSGGFAKSTPLTFQFAPSQGKWWCPYESHLQISMSVFGTTADANLNLALNAAQSIAPLAPACLFESLQFEINGKQIESIQSNIAQHAALRFRLQNKLDQRASGKTSLWGEPDRLNAIAPSPPGTGANEAAIGASASAGALASGTYGVLTPSLTSVPVGVASQQLPVTQTGTDRQFVFASSRKQTFNLKLPLGVFHQKLCLPQATYTIRAQLANEFARALQTFSATATSIVNSATPGAAACQIRIDGLDMICAYCDYGASGMLTNRIIIPTSNIYMTTYALSTTSSTDNVNINGLPKSAIKYYFWLQRQTANSGAANHVCSPTEFHLQPAAGRNGLPPAPAAAGRNPVFGLRNFQAQIGGRTGPNPMAQFEYNINENNLMKYYRQYELSVACLEPEDYDQWLARGPIYSFPQINIHSVDDIATDMVIRMERDDTLAGQRTDAGADTQAFQVPTNLYIAALTERSFTMNVVGGQVTSVVENDR